MRPRLHVGCQVDGCDQPHLARGYCNVHYKRQVARAHVVRQSNQMPFDRDARLEDCRFMADTGETLTGAARRIGISRPALEAWLRNHDPATLSTLAERDRWPEESRATFHFQASA